MNTAQRGSYMAIDLHRLEEVDWPGLIRVIRARLVLNQRELAERCAVSPQAVSAWNCGRRRPDTHACRKLLALCREVGIEVADGEPDWERMSIEDEREEWRFGEADRDLRELVKIFRSLASPARREVLNYARFRVQSS